MIQSDSLVGSGNRVGRVKESQKEREAILHGDDFHPRTVKLRMKFKVDTAPKRPKQILSQIEGGGVFFLASRLFPVRFSAAARVGQAKF